MPKLTQDHAYMIPSVQRQIVDTFVEPYRTLLLVQANCRGATPPRSALVKAVFTDVTVDPDTGQVHVLGCLLTPAGRAYLLAYLRGFMRREKCAQTPWLFPLPSNPNKHASYGVCKQMLARLMAPPKKIAEASPGPDLAVQSAPDPFAQH